MLLLFSSHSGTAIMQDGNTMRNNYGCDLDSLTTNSRIGMMRSASGNLHYYINGVDQGIACSGLPPGKKLFSYTSLWLEGTTSMTSVSLSLSSRRVRCHRSVRSVRSGVHHQLLGPAGQQPVHQQRHREELPHSLPRCSICSFTPKCKKHKLLVVFKLVLMSPPCL